MKLGGIRKALLAAFPMVAMAGNYLGFDVTPEWWEGAIVVVTPLLVWWLSNNEDSVL
ncbi:MAG: hypothetical protein ACR2RF_25425 [Geminicoccaceae bacterium]